MAGRITTAAALFLFMCGEDEGVTVEAEPSDDQAAPVSAAAPSASNGGTVVSVGPLQVEVVAREDGDIDAFVLGAAPPPPDRTQITVSLTGDDGGAHPVILIWDPSQSRYRGRLRQVLPNPGPVEVVVVLAGETHRGRAPSIVLAPPNPLILVDDEPDSPNSGGVVIDRGPDGPPPAPPGAVVYQDGPPSPPGVLVGVREPRPQVVVRAPVPPPPPQARFVVERPAPPSVRVVAPAPPQARIVVERPRPEPVRVEVRGRGRRQGRGHGGRHGPRVRIGH